MEDGKAKPNARDGMLRYIQSSLNLFAKQNNMHPIVRDGEPEEFRFAVHVRNGRIGALSIPLDIGSEARGGSRDLEIGITRVGSRYLAQGREASRGPNNRDVYPSREAGTTIKKCTLSP